jgi:hypothetical protein
VGSGRRLPVLHVRVAHHWSGVCLPRECLMAVNQSLQVPAMVVQLHRQNPNRYAKMSTDSPAEWSISGFARLSSPLSPASPPSSRLRFCDISLSHVHAHFGLKEKKRFLEGYGDHCEGTPLRVR